MMFVLLAVIGVIVGTVGTLIGAGGGFLLMPILVMLYPQERPEVLASISLAVVFFNALSGSFGYARQKKIDYRSAWVFIAAGIPGAVIGAMITSRIPRSAFDLALGCMLIAVALFLIVAGRLRPAVGEKGAARREHRGAAASEGDQAGTLREDVRGANVAELREEHDREGERRGFTGETVPYARLRGAALSLVVGVVSSLLGIGGGIIHVPGMVYLLRFPVHLAAGTSHFVLAFTAATGTAAHLANGEFHSGYRRTAALAVGVIAGAQIGARLSRVTPTAWILRVLAVAIGLVGIRVVMQAVQGTGP